jgi:uncharacterized protein (TIGR02284 family)
MSNSKNLPNDVEQALRDLIEINNDSHKGHLTAAEAIEDRELAGMFRAIATLRKQHAEELSSFVDNPPTGSYKGALHRYWIEARTALGGNDAYTVLAEAERGEDEIKRRYEALAGKVSGHPMSSAVFRQSREVQMHHDRIRRLRDERKAAEQSG